MASNVALTEQAKKECAQALSRVLADTFLLYLKTHNYHWNVVGPKFRSLHMMFEEQYQDLWNSIDDIAERIRALGQYAPGTCSQFKALATLEETEEVPAADDMLRELVRGNEAVSQSVRNALAVAQEVGDEASAGLLGERLVYHEKQLWMMQSTLAG